MKAEYDFSRGKRGAVLSTHGKTRMTVYLDDNVVKAFEVESARTGRGYQTLINRALARHTGIAEMPRTTTDEIVARRNPKRCPTHPGALLREDILPALEVPKKAIGDALGISRQHLYDILSERKPVSAEVAVRLGAAFGNGPELWLRMQAAYDTWHASRKVDIRKVPRLVNRRR
jgi:addiction module HigA family antidote